MLHVIQQRHGIGSRARVHYHAEQRPPWTRGRQRIAGAIPAVVHRFLANRSTGAVHRGEVDTTRAVRSKSEGQGATERGFVSVWIRCHHQIARGARRIATSQTVVIHRGSG
ncbi:hypothetical protein D3C75_1147810 [compost metagenome]